ncbi:MAG: hypothetical protein FWD71_08805 [Oscillospiraceae bacterium]|nr:hypothetical protein [Oscillospiraceae bacterium]
MKDAKKILSVIIALTFMLTLFSGCSSTNSGADNNNTTLEDSTTTEVTTTPETTYPALQTETSSDGTQIYDFFNTDYVFVPDNEAVGEWQAVDFVKNIQDFKPGEYFTAKSNLYFTRCVFYDDGDVSETVSGSGISTTTRWTKGYVLNTGSDKVVSSYEIDEINGTDYLFIQWKAGNYTNNGFKPWYYVFEKVDSFTDHTSGYDSIARDYYWYIDQAGTGEYSDVNCAIMAGLWYDKNFNVTVEDARNEIPNNGNGWNTNNMETFLKSHNIPYELYANTSLTNASDITNQLNLGNIVIIPINTAYLTTNVFY